MEEIEESIKKKELEKLNLEIKKLRKFVFLRPEFLGLFIPLISILITYWINREDINSALKQREQKIAIENKLLQLQQRDLQEKETKIIGRIDSLEFSFKNKNDSLKLAYKAKTDSLNNVVTNLNKTTTSLNVQKMALQSKISSLESEFDFILPKEYVTKIIGARYLTIADEVRYFVKLLKDTTKNSNREQYITFLETIIDTTQNLQHRIRIQSLLVNGTKRSYELNPTYFNPILKWLENEYTEITPELISDLGATIWADQEVFPAVELVLEKFRLGLLDSEVSIHDFLNVLQYHLPLDQRPHAKFKNMENYFFVLEQSSKVIHDYLAGVNNLHNNQARAAIATLRRYAPLAFAALASKFILDFPEKREFIYYNILPDLEYFDIEYYSVYKYSIPTDITLELWQEWSSNNSDLIKLWIGPDYSSIKNDTNLLEI